MVEEGGVCSRGGEMCHSEALAPTDGEEPASGMGETEEEGGGGSRTPLGL